jgi:pilus assembly protein CpaF
MIMMAGFDLPIAVIREQMASAIHLIIHLNRLADGSRKVVQVTEVAGLEGPTVTLQDLFVFTQQGIDQDGKVLGVYTPMGIRPQFADRLKAAGVDFAADLFGVTRWG